MEFDSPQQEIPRDRFGRPMVEPVGGGKPEPYTRCTTYVDVLEDKYNLQKWQQRMVILGMVERQDLMLSAAVSRDDKSALNKLAEQAVEAAKASAAANVGTALHAICERYDAGLDVGPIPEQYKADFEAYKAATSVLNVIAAERFTVRDDLKIGGTPDQIVDYQGERFIADIKTGTIDLGAGKIAMQLAVYANSVFYDHATKQRTPLPEGVSRERGIVIHLPAGAGKCTLHWVDLAAGWEAVTLATQVREWRSRKGLIKPLSGVSAKLGDPVDVTDMVLAAITNSSTVEDLTAVWAANKDKWTSTHTEAAANRKQELV